MKSRHGPFFVRHDLMHYAVETTLGFDEAFYGLVAAGRSIESFNSPRSGKALPRQAGLAEFIVGLLDQNVRWNEGIDQDQFNRDLCESLKAGGVPVSPALPGNQIQAIMNRHRELTLRYTSLQTGECLELPFPANDVHQTSPSAGKGKMPAQRRG